MLIGGKQRIATNLTIVGSGTTNNFGLITNCLGARYIKGKIWGGTGAFVVQTMLVKPSWDGVLKKGCSTLAASTSLVVPDVTGLTTGMSVFGADPAVIAPTKTITVSGSTVTLSGNAASTASGLTLAFGNTIAIPYAVYTNDWPTGNTLNIAENVGIPLRIVQATIGGGSNIYVPYITDPALLIQLTGAAAATDVTTVMGDFWPVFDDAAPGLSNHQGPFKTLNMPDASGA